MNLAQIEVWKLMGGYIGIYMVPQMKPDALQVRLQRECSA
jgi:hypothetical protein